MKNINIIILLLCIYISNSSEILFTDYKGNLHKSNDSGKTWETIRIKKVSKIVFTTASNMVKTSFDSGKTWNIEKNNDRSKISYYYQKNTNTIIITETSNLENIDLEIYDIFGNKIYSKYFKQIGDKNLILAGFNPSEGLYRLKLSNKDIIKIINIRI